MILRTSFLALETKPGVLLRISADSSTEKFFSSALYSRVSLSKEHFLRLELNSGSCHQKRYNKIHLCHTLSKLNSFAYTRQERRNAFFVTFMLTPRQCVSEFHYGCDILRFR